MKPFTHGGPMAGVEHWFAAPPDPSQEPPARSSLALAPRTASYASRRDRDSGPGTTRAAKASDHDGSAPRRLFRTASGSTPPLTAIRPAAVGLILDLTPSFACRVLWPQGLGGAFEASSTLIAVGAALVQFALRGGRNGAARGSWSAWAAAAPDALKAVRTQDHIARRRRRSSGASSARPAAKLQATAGSGTASIVCDSRCQRSMMPSPLKSVSSRPLPSTLT